MIDLVPPTAALADACVRLGVPLRVGPASLRPIAAHAPIAGPALPVTHAGSVDVFLEAIDDAPPGAQGGRLNYPSKVTRGNAGCCLQTALRAHAAQKSALM